ncbi:Protein DBF4-like protein B, partial [Camelus dromedarius]
MGVTGDLGNDWFELEGSMAESRLQAPDLGAQLGVSSCLGKCQKHSPDAGRQPFSGKSFYLDLPAGKNLQFLTGAIQQLGGVIEGFLSKEVSYIVSSRREAKAESSGTSHRGCPSPSKIRVETLPMAHPKGSHPRPAQKPADSVPLSRGKELLQAAIRNQGSSSSLLSNARSWGVRILHVDGTLPAPGLLRTGGPVSPTEMVMYVQHLSLDALCVKKQGPEKPEVGPPTELKGNSKACDNFGKMSNRVKNTERADRQLTCAFFLPVARLKAPFLKVEDESREARDREPSPQSAARTVPRRKKGYCECCQEAFEELHRHLQSPQHRGFALEAHSYAEVDWIIAQLSHSFADIPFQASLPGTASPRRRKEDDRQAPGAPEQDGTVGDTQAPAEPVEAGKTPGPPASCQEPEELADVFVDPSGTPAYQCLLTSSGFTELSSGSDLALVGHKRKIQFPS